MALPVVLDGFLLADVLLHPRRGSFRALGILRPLIQAKDGLVHHRVRGVPMTFDLAQADECSMLLNRFEVPQRRFVAPLLRPGDTFVDIGAYIGWYTAMAASRVGTSGQVITVEPNPALHSRLQKMLDGNPYQNGRLVPKAVSGTAGTMPFFVAKHPAVSSLRDDWAPELRSATYNIPVTTLDVLMGEMNWPKVRMIKVDAEGYEFPILFEGGIETLRKAPPDFILYDREPGERLAQAAAGLEYTMFTLGSDARLARGSRSGNGFENATVFVHNSVGLPSQMVAT